MFKMGPEIDENGGLEDRKSRKMMVWQGLGVLEGLWGTFLASAQLLRALFLVLEALWATLWHQMAPRSDFFGFGIRFGIHFGRLLGSL